jgi:large subunit ribosomal protein L6
MLNNELQKSLKINPKLQVYFIILKGNKFLFIKDYNKYFKIPSNLNCVLENETLILKTQGLHTKDHSLLLLVYNSILNYLKRVLNPVKKTLKLKGLGFRINVLKDLGIIEFKLGFSHLKKLKVPFDKVNVIVQKNTISVEGVDNVWIGNFLNKIRSLKEPDIYKGKGFWYKYQKESFKVIKKK